MAGKVCPVAGSLRGVVESSAEDCCKHLMKAALLPEAGKLCSRNLTVSEVTLRTDNSTLRADGEELDGAGLAECSVSVGETCWVWWLQV